MMHVSNLKKQFHTLNPTILRAYDVRGIYEKTLNSLDVYLLARAFAADLLKNNGKSVCVGYDTRLSSPELEQAVVQGLKESGLDVIRIGICPSPMLYFAQKHLNTDAGLMITGSHNPAEYNGIKFCLKSGPFFGEDIQRIGAIVEVGDFLIGEGVVKNEAILAPYVSRLMADFTQYYSDGRPLRIVWDPAHGAACHVLKELIKKLPGEHWVINGVPDGRFPAHHPDPSIEKNMTQLSGEVARHQADLGIGFDGDGDRIGVVDGKGRLLMGDQLLAFYSQELIHTHKGDSILVDVKASQVVLDRMQELGFVSQLTRTGHSYIKRRMKDLNCPLAGEMSGHMFFADRYFGFDDGLYAAIRLIGALSLQKESLAGWLDAFPETHITPEKFHPCDDSTKFQKIDAIKETLRRQNISFLDVDGVRVSSCDGWWLLRASNTQAVIVSRAESQTAEGLQRLIGEINKTLNQVGL